MGGQFKKTLGKFGKDTDLCILSIKKLLHYLKLSFCYSEFKYVCQDLSNWWYKINSNGNAWRTDLLK